MTKQTNQKEHSPLAFNKEKELNRRINLAKTHLAEIINSQTFRKEIEIAEKEAQTEGTSVSEAIEAYWKLQGKLSRGPLANHLINYKGIDNATAFVIRLADILNGIEMPEEKWLRVREGIKEFLKEDREIFNSETLKNLSEKAILEDTMDGFYNLLKSFRKNIGEIVKIKGNEENANSFLEKMTDVVYDRLSGCSLRV